MTVAVLLGLGVGVGLCLLLAGLRPAPVTLATALHRLDNPPPIALAHTGLPTTAPQDLLGRVRWWLGQHSHARLHLGDGRWGGLTGDLDADLAVTGTAPALHTGSKTLAALTGFATPLLLAGLLGAAGQHLPLLIPLWLCLTGALVGFLLPDLRLRRHAADARRAFRTTVGAYLDLVAMRMASGSGLAEALHDAASIGTGPAFARIRGCLADARTDGLTPAQALGRLGAQLHLPDLVDVSTRLRLVDTSGAQAQLSLRAQAASLRDRELTDAQGRANERSQSMLVAQVVLGLGFVLFLGYPAVVRILAT